MNEKLKKWEELEFLKSELSKFDFIGVKIAMGVATKEEYAEQPGLLMLKAPTPHKARES